MSEMTAEDYDSVESAERALVGQGWRPGTLNEHVEGWASLVGIVEDGYTMTVYDYTNDLAVRHWLQLAQPMVSERVRDSLRSRLAPLDERFLVRPWCPRDHFRGAVRSGGVGFRAGWSRSCAKTRPGWISSQPSSDDSPAPARSAARSRVPRGQQHHAGDPRQVWGNGGARGRAHASLTVSG
jgi:hypothetical protein